MNDLIFKRIAKIGSSLKKLQFKQVLLVALVGFVVLFNTACSSKVADATQSAANPNPYTGQGKMQKEMYDAVQRPAGGMNNYNDDAKYDSDKTQMQTQKSINQVKGNLKKRVDLPQDLVENIRDTNPLGGKLQETAENVQKSAEKLQKDLVKGTDRGIDNIQRNVEQARNAAPQVFEQAKQNAQGAAKDLRMGGSKDLSNNSL
jgi:membrane-associated HD superfamily phosphohydrolase